MLLKCGSHVTFHNLLGSMGACWAQPCSFSTAASDAQCITKSLVLFCIDCESCFFNPAYVHIYIYIYCLFYMNVLNCPKPQVPPVKCKSWLSPLEPSKYTLLGITKNILSARDVKESPLGLSMSEYLEKNEWVLLLI